MDLQAIMLSDHRYREQTSGYQRGGGLVAKQVKRVKDTVKDGNQACGGDHSVVYRDAEL